MGAEGGSCRGPEANPGVLPRKAELTHLMLKLIDLYVYHLTESGRISILLLKRSGSKIYSGQWRMIGGKAEAGEPRWRRSEEHTSELQSRGHLVCRLLLEKKKDKRMKNIRM